MSTVVANHQNRDEAGVEGKARASRLHADTPLPTGQHSLDLAKMQAPGELRGPV